MEKPMTSRAQNGGRMMNQDTIAGGAWGVRPQEEKHWMREAIEKKNRDGILRHQLNKKTRVFCSTLFTVFLLADFKIKPDSILTFKIHAKNIRETKKAEPVREWHFVERKNEGRKNSRLRGLEFMPRNLN
jgi:hypothetical protein